RPAADVQQVMPVAQTERRKQVELQRAAEIVERFLTGVQTVLLRSEELLAVGAGLDRPVLTHGFAQRIVSGEAGIAAPARCAECRVRKSWRGAFAAGPAISRTAEIKLNHFLQHRLRRAIALQQ